jgi:hypothetical protein
VQGCPERLGEQARVDAVPGDLAEGLDECGKGVLEMCRGVLLGVCEAAAELEQGVVDRRVTCGEVEEGTGQGGDPQTTSPRGRPSPPSSAVRQRAP